MKQGNHCVSLLGKLNRKYYSSLDVKSITDKKTVEPFLSDKVTTTQKLTLP